MGFKANITNLIHQIVIGMLFILSHVGIVTFNPTFSTGLDVWVGMNLIGMAFLLLRRRFTTPKVIDAKCLSCHTSMDPSKLTCTNCGSTFTISK